jgi:hypothetical protein
MFVIYCLLIGLTGSRFPVRLIKAITRNGKEEILGILDATAKTLQSIKVSVQSDSFDGDRLHKKIANDLSNFGLARIRRDFGLFAQTFGSRFDGPLSIEDPLQIENTERYRNV